MSQTSRCALELAVVTVSNPDSFDVLQRHTHDLLAHFPGYVRSRALRSLKDPARRADLVVWDSLTEANAASASMQQDPRFVPFMQAMERVELFQHYVNVPSDGLAVVHHSIIEIAAYLTHPEVPMTTLQRTLHNTLTTHIPGSQSLLAAQRHNAEDQLECLDVIAWRDVASHRQAPAQVLAHNPSLQDFFERGIVRQDLFELFEEV